MDNETFITTVCTELTKIKGMVFTQYAEVYSTDHTSGDTNNFSNMINDLGVISKNLDGVNNLIKEFSNKYGKSA